MAQPLTVIWRLVAGIAALTGGFGAAAGQEEANQSQRVITCVNPFSGAHWQITIDYDRGTVDSNPARISSADISWRDATDGWNYRLDRKSGALTVTLASATGGNFLHDQCDLGN